MDVETLKDFLKWTQKFHLNMARGMQDCAREIEDERAKMLLKYLSKNEEKLAKIMSRVAETAENKTLNTWVYEFFNKSNITKNNDCRGLFEGLEPMQIIERVTSQHNEIMTFYRDLSAETTLASTKTFLQELISLEKNHIKQMVQSTNRMSDM